MAALDEPERYRFERRRPGAALEGPKAMADWTRCLTGPGLARYMADTYAAPAWRTRRTAQASGGLKPGLTRGGKPLADA